jgi:hypothetical protein
MAAILVPIEDSSTAEILPSHRLLAGSVEPGPARLTIASKTA